MRAIPLHTPSCRSDARGQRREVLEAERGKVRCGVRPLPLLVTGGVRIRDAEHPAALRVLALPVRPVRIGAREKKRSPS